MTVVIVVEVIAEVKDKGALVLPGCCSPLGKGQAGQTIEDNRGKRKEAKRMKSVGKLGSG